MTLSACLCLHVCVSACVCVYRRRIKYACHVHLLVPLSPSAAVVAVHLALGLILTPLTDKTKTKWDTRETATETKTKTTTHLRSKLWCTADCTHGTRRVAVDKHVSRNLLIFQSAASSAVCRKKSEENRLTFQPRWKSRFSMLLHIVATSLIRI